MGGEVGVEDPTSVLQQLQCDICGQAVPKFQCARCRNAFYCSVQCQKDHWLRGHKKVCVPFEEKSKEVFQKFHQINTEENVADDEIIDHASKLVANSENRSLSKDRAEFFVREAIACLKRFPPLKRESFDGGRWDEFAVMAGNLLLGKLYIRLETYDTAQKLIEEVLHYIQNSPNEGFRACSTDVETQLGHAFAGQEKWQNALEHYNRVRVKYEELLGDKYLEDVHSTDVLCRITHCKLVSGDTEGARETITHLLAKNPKAKGAHLEFAKVLEKEGDLEAARAEVLKGSILEVPWDSIHRNTNLVHAEYLSDAIERRKEIRVLEEDFINVWGRVLELTETPAFEAAPKTWGVLYARNEVDGRARDDDEEARDERLLGAGREAARRAEEEEEEEEDDVAAAAARPVTASKDFEDVEIDKTVDPIVDPSAYGSIKLSNEALKWHRTTEPFYRNLFIKKLARLAQGQWSHTGAKRLVGKPNCTPIYETYLENSRGGHRILWTRPSGTILIWYVKHHDYVERSMKLIYEAEKRSMKQLVPATDILGMASPDDTGEVVLDPKSDVPLKLFELGSTKVDKLSFQKWRPPMHMTPKERAIVETPGSVCVLGRSGTGKTVCISSRIHNDRHNFQDHDGFSQLFVARSRRICDYVKEAVGEETDRDTLEYWTYRKLLMKCEEKMVGPSVKYSDKYRVDYQRYCTMFHRSDWNLDPLVAWTQIRSFIKGSMKAVTEGRPLEKQEYLELGAKECRLDREQRETAYMIFTEYKKGCERGGLWDDNDRVVRILSGMKQMQQDDMDAFRDFQKSRLYVDEIQDYNQAEIALFFALCDHGGLFLAGDPAQSVEEGIDFRFEDVRSVAHHLFKTNEGKNRRIPDKPRMLKVNFRSHAGVLNLAASVLDKMFQAFPGSFKELPRDEGFFRGPRPTVLPSLSTDSLKELVGKLDCVVLAMNDTTVARLQQELGERIDVLSIRDSKGLEFDVVLIVDFFLDLSKDKQPYWKTLFTPRNESDVEDIRKSAPELETQLKQLYTAITRCCKKLVLAETGESLAFEAFRKWAFIRPEKDEKDTRFVEMMNVADVQESKMSFAERTKQGLQFARSAEESSNPDATRKKLERAYENFREGGDHDNMKRAGVHLDCLKMRGDMLALERIQGESMEPFIDMIVSLLGCGLHLEASRLGHALIDRMGGESAERREQYTREQLTNRLLSVLPNLDEY